MNAPRHLAAAAIATLALRGAAPAAEPDLTDVKRWVAHGQELRSVSADFVQERQLRSIKRPLVSTGTFQFSAPSSFRWQLGEPAQTVAVRSGEGPLLVLRPAKKKALRYSAEDIAAGGGRGAAGFLTAGFPRDFATFQKTFVVTEVAREGTDHVFTARPRDRRTSLALRKVVFTVDAASLKPRKVYLRFRDGSSIETRFTEVRENAAVDAAAFSVDLAGYAVEDADL